MKVKKKRRKQKEAEKEFQQKVGMFDKIPDSCDSCKKTFDKKDKNMVYSWSVVVKEKEEVVRLYCPTCWDTAKRVIEEFKTQTGE